jgi:Tfp pilus assembly protein PilX
MKKIFFKKNRGPARTGFRGACQTKSFRRGFALLFSVLVSSLLLAVGLSIFNIALKELSISNATRQSIIAFYAADSGREQAYYNDTKTDDYRVDPLDNNPWSPFPGEGKVMGSDGPSFEFKVVKEWKDISTKTVIKTTITSTGKNVSFGDRIEREISQTYP